MELMSVENYITKYRFLKHIEIFSDVKKWERERETYWDFKYQFPVKRFPKTYTLRRKLNPDGKRYSSKKAKTKTW